MSSKILHGAAAKVFGFFRTEKLLTALLVLYAALCVATGGFALRLNELVDFRIVAFVTALLLVSRGVERSGFFSFVSVKLVEFSGGSMRRFLALSTVLTALTAAIVTNDTAIFIYVPLALAVSRVYGSDAAPAVAVVAVAANVGSALTPIGNPQNIVIWHHYGVSFTEFVAALAPFTAMGLATLLVYGTLVYPAGGTRQVTAATPPRVKILKKLLTVSSLLLVTDLALAQLGLQYTALAVTVAALLIVDYRTVASIDYTIILVFTLILADFKALSTLIHIPSAEAADTAYIVLVAAALSQAVSNVPATVILANKVKDWKALAIGANLGGVGTVTGSLANMIAIRLSGTNIKNFHKYTLPYFTILLTETLIYIYITQCW